MRAFNLPDGVLNVRISKKYKKVLKALHYGTGEILKIIEETQLASLPIISSVQNVPTVQTAQQNVIPPVPSVESDMRRALAGELTMQIERPCDQFGRIQKLGKSCSQCEKRET